MQFGIPTVIVHPIGQDLFRDLINKNVFYYSLDATEILHQVENFKSKELDEGYQIKVSEQLALETFNSIILQ